MPKKIDRSNWILLDHGRDQCGWLDTIGAKLYGGFRTRWWLPDGSEHDRRERVHLGGASLGVKLGQRLLMEKIGEFFNANLNAAGRPPVRPSLQLFRFCLPSNVRRKRYDSAPVSMMWARSVTRSSSALHSRAFGNTCVHSEKGKFVVRITAAFSARSLIT